jgi:hypothetical protein
MTGSALAMWSRAMYFMVRFSFLKARVSLDGTPRFQ